MHPKALLDECASLIEKVFKFDHPADAVVARHFRENKSLGPRERATLSDTVFAVLRERLRLEWLARSGSGSKWRRLAILGFPGDRDFLKSALTDVEKTWLDHCLAQREKHAARYDAPGRWWAQAAVQGTGKVYLDAANAYRRPGYGLLNLAAGYAQGSWEIAASLRNAATRRYDAVGYLNGQVVVYSPPREFGVRLTWRM